MEVSQSASHGYYIVIKASVKLGVVTHCAVIEEERVRYKRRVEPFSDKIKFSEFKGPWKARGMILNTKLEMSQVTSNVDGVDESEEEGDGIGG